ncbi:hypothetical protein [Knoellia aerolata]|uniref:MinD-like ATPase involved in chromosome partitioning or flagellar assembly n=1 Tax=Knoellia aerolata DSM 18566 TaxID=1385519 RepID=A0A0A0JV52_9MICO|nr:hypothetical protein [Knoellia aerolata]KGN41033.1 hypothetical protein N801_09745 [Knoellia aerolata DSM 18566]
MTSVARSRPVGVDELRRAYWAVQAGTFRRGHRVRRPTPGWTPSAPVLAVVGACAGTGASTLALALATAAETARVVECASPTAAGLSAAATAELGRDPDGWVRGARDAVLIERPADVLGGPHEVPHPRPSEHNGLMVVDVAWELGTVLAGHGWLTDLLEGPGPVVLTAPATVPGLRRLDAALGLLAHARPVVALLGPRRRALPRHIASALAALSRSHDLAGRVVEVPADTRLRTCGVDSTPLPQGLLRAATELLALTDLNRRDHAS